MASRRDTTPPPSSPMEFGDPALMPPPSTPGPGSGNANDNIIMGTQHAVVPPSPAGMPEGLFASLTVEPAQDPDLLSPKSKANQRASTGAGIKKRRLKTKANGTMAKLVDAAFGEKSGASDKALHKPFRFMDLPGEIRNLVYQHTYGSPKQALLVHRPRMASLRSRTRHDRARPLASDIADKEHDTALFHSKRSRSSRKPKAKSSVTPRETNRPFVGLTQVSQLIRNEYCPIYLKKQEIGMDLTGIVEYLKTFYYDAADRLDNLGAPGGRVADLPFTGNLTIAVGEKLNDKEVSAEGVEVFPLLDVWANSYKIEAGFGRYQKADYAPEHDGEAKDFYRLFGRRVLRNRSCSPMNFFWRTILRNRALASIRIHRKPAARLLGIGGLVGSAPPTPTTGVFAVAPLGNVFLDVKPYFHIIFKKEWAEPWMTKFESDIPKNPDWLMNHGFGSMEHFDIKVGVAPTDAD